MRCPILIERQDPTRKSNSLASVLTLLIGLTFTAIACSGLTQGVSPSTRARAITLSLSPGSTTVGSREELQFTATISGSPNTAVTWSATAGTISPNGLFTAPDVASNTTVVITATRVGDSLHASASVVVTGSSTASDPGKPVTITTRSLPIADVGTPYNATLAATGGDAPYRWSLVRGKLPSGIEMHPSGEISGVASGAGAYHFGARVMDAKGKSFAAVFHLSVSINSTTPPSSMGSAMGFDGPAELPRILIQTPMANTATPGETITVNAGGDLQSALNSANCGDTVQLQAGATFNGSFTFPAKSCDDSHWIMVRTSAADSSLPAEGTRLTPCYAGVSSLPGRPAFQCSSTKNVLAKIVMPTVGNGPILFASGANHYRLMGLEITRSPGTGLVSTLSAVANSGTASNLIFDRLWMHGTSKDDTTRGVWLEGDTYVSVVDSTLTDFHCTSVTGSCGDSQAIAGGIGNGPMGPYKISNNFLEASGENILFGGGAANSTPTDIEISRNHIFKPLTWMKGQPGYVGGSKGNPFTAKNLLEFKNAQRVLIEGNILENSWGGFSQEGFGILLTPKNQSGSECTMCEVSDVTVRYNTISHVGGGLQIANALANNVGAALHGERYSIHDIVVDDIDGSRFDGQGLLAQISVTAGGPVLQDLSINHVSAFPAQTLFMVGDMVRTSGPMKNFTFSNSIVTAGQYPVWSTGGGSTNCAYHDVPQTTFKACFTGSAFTTNAIIGASSSYPATSWPSSNYFPASATTVQFVNYKGGSGGDYHLQSSSPYKNLGTDGKDLGADIDALSSEIAGVE